MPFNCKQETGKSLNCMTFHAIGGYIVSYKLSVVVICMAICTSAMIYGIGQPVLMTRFTVNNHMFTLQRETCIIMIKILYPLNRTEGFLTVALPAVLSKLIFMRILMATGAVSVWNAGELLEFPFCCNLNTVALRTINTSMFPGQLKSGVVVREFSGRDKRVLIMAVCTYGRKRPHVIVLMACKTSGVHTEISLLPGFKIRVSYIF